LIVGFTPTFDLIPTESYEGPEQVHTGS